MTAFRHLRPLARQRAQVDQRGAFAGPRSLGGRRRDGPLLPVLLVEPLDPAGGVEELLLAGIEGMAGRADVRHERRARRVGLDLVAARAADGGWLVQGVKTLLRHGAE